MINRHIFYNEYCNCLTFIKVRIIYQKNRVIFSFIRLCEKWLNIILIGYVDEQKIIKNAIFI